MKSKLTTKESPDSLSRATADLITPDPPTPEAADLVIDSLTLTSLAPTPSETDLDKTLSAIDASATLTNDGLKLLTPLAAINIFGNYAAAKTQVDTLRSLGVRVAIVGDHER